jgi:predicted enzyme related to lactoylglutathione lyase
MGVKSIEVVSIPVSDQDRARQFYAETLGFRLDVDAPFEENMRWVQLTPPEGGASITLMTWQQGAPPGSLKDLYLAVDDIQGTYDALKQRGVNFTDEPFDSPFGRFAHFEDPDGNGWVLHENNQ